MNSRITQYDPNIRDIERWTSDIGYRTSHRKYDMYQTPNIGYLASDIQHRIQKSGYRTSDTEHRVSNIGYRTSDTEHRISNIKHRTSDIGHLTSDIEYWISNIASNIGHFEQKKKDIEHRMYRLSDNKPNLSPHFLRRVELGREVTTVHDSRSH